MDNFITTIIVLYDNINKEKLEGPRLINNKVAEKQYLAYYIYRIWIKYRKLMENSNTPTEFRKILSYMEIPKKYHEIYLTYPMANKMTTNEKQLDLIILSILKHFNTTYKLYGPRPDGSLPPESKDFKSLTTQLTGKSIENIVQDVIQIKLLIPNLSRPANVRNMWDGIDQILNDIDTVNPLQFPNPATEIPDTKLELNNPDKGVESSASAEPMVSSATSSIIEPINNSSIKSNVINPVSQKSNVVTSPMPSTNKPPQNKKNNIAKLNSNKDSRPNIPIKKNNNLPVTNSIQKGSVKKNNSIKKNNNSNILTESTN